MNYKRLTQRVYGQTYSVNHKIYYDDVADIVERLAELEDKIESGELVDKTELEKAVAEKQGKGQELDVKTIFRDKDGSRVELPRKIGDKVYHIYKNPFSNYSIGEETVRGYEYDNNGIGWRLRLTTCTPSIKCIGDNIFLTREEAEKKLKELKGEE